MLSSIASAFASSPVPSHDHQALVRSEKAQRAAAMDFMIDELQQRQSARLAAVTPTDSAGLVRNEQCGATAIDSELVTANSRGGGDGADSGVVGVGIGGVGGDGV